jgi:hypothetical protein
MWFGFKKVVGDQYLRWLQSKDMNCEEFSEVPELKKYIPQ